MQKEATPVIVAEDSFTKTIPARSGMVVLGIGELWLLHFFMHFQTDFSTDR